MAKNIESKRITNYQQIEFVTDIFWPLAEWSTTSAESNVVVFSNGNVLLTDSYTSKLETIIRQMAHYLLKANKFYIADKQVINEFLDGVFEQEQQSTIINDELTEAREDLRDLIMQAVDNNVSDIHLEVRKRRAKICFRKDGDMYTLKEWSAQRVTRLCFVAFNRESDDVKKHFNSIIPHDASMEIVIKNINVRVRLASIPAYPYPSFDVVFRILTVQENVMELEDLGYSKDQVMLFKKNIGRKSGAIILAGATGSGKTTTLASLIQQLPKENKIYTIEDPVEKKLTNATQIPTNDDNPLCTFSSLVRQTLRMDPDCIVIGEVRDEDTAQMMSRASITGHLVLTTLHANSAVNIVLRLKDLGIDINTLTDPNFLAVLGYQTLVKKLCQSCKRPSSNLFHKSILGNNISINGTDPNCKKCNGTSVHGRVVVAELIQLGEKELNYIHKGEWFKWIADIRSRKESITDKILTLIESGLISVKNAESAVGLIPELNV